MHFLARNDISRFVAFIDFSGFSGFEMQTTFLKLSEMKIYGDFE
jgi:hypothetical protein